MPKTQKIRKAKNEESWYGGGSDNGELMENLHRADIKQGLFVDARMENEW